MHLFTELWLPMVVATVLVFLASSIVHMLLPIHKGDYRRLPEEGEITALLRSRAVAPGAYSFPFPASMKDMASPEMVAKYQQGPVGLLTVLPNGIPAVGKALVWWVAYCAAVSVLVGYLALMAFGWGASGVDVFRFTSTAALLGYGIPHLHEAIWKGQGWITTLKYVLDGVLYSLVTGGTFLLLWPAAP
jgi:hypothetical protein